MNCFAHTLQLVVGKFSEVRSCSSTIKKAHGLVKKVNKSTKATELLIQHCGKKLVKDCPTRWSSTFLLINRLLEVRSALSRVLCTLEWDDLPTSEWKTLENIQTLLQPFAQYTSLISGEEYTTLSAIIPAILELTLHLEQMKKVTGVAEPLEIAVR